MLVIAWILPIAAGVAVWLAINPQRGPGWRSSALGYGIVFGMMLAAGATSLFARNDTTHALRSAGSVLAIVGIAAGLVAWRRSKRVAAIADESPSIFAAPLGLRVLCGLAFASLAWRSWIAFREILLRPTFPWDAWDAWAVKSKAWYMLGHYVPFVSMQHWITQSTPGSFTGIAWSYPGTLGWIQVWFASAIGSWVEPGVNLPWLAVWFGSILAHYGQWRALGVTSARALLGIYFLASLPLITVHVALAGYADLWIATLFAFAVLAWLRWNMTRDLGQLIVFVVCLLTLPFFKLEGAVWLLLFAIVALFALLPRRFRKLTAVACTVVVVVGLIFGKLVLPLLTIGWVHVGPHVIEVPVLGPLSIAWHSGALEGTLRSLFEQPNWNLLWWMTPVIIVWRWPTLRAQPTLRVLGSLLSICFAFLLFLFLFTDAARFAESFTAINRLVMHLVPSLITLLVLLLRDARFRKLSADTTAPSAMPTSPT